MMHYTEELIKHTISVAETETTVGVVLQQYREDWLELHAENRSLRDRLRDEKDMNAAEHIVQDRLYAENDRLREAAAAVVEAWRWSVRTTGDFYDALETLRRTLGIPLPPADETDTPDDVVPCTGCGEPVTTCPEGIAFCDACARDNENPPADDNGDPDRDGDRRPEHSR